MTRLKKELHRRNIIGSWDDDYDTVVSFVGIDRGKIIVAMYCLVLDPQVLLYDARTLTEIGGQDMYPDHHSFRGREREWYSYVTED